MPSSSSSMSVDNELGDEAHLSFSGGGFLGIYHVGVLQALKDFAPEITARKVLGASSGALAASCLVCDLPVEGAIDTITKMTVHCRSLSLGPMHPNFNIADILRKGLSDHLPADAHVRSTGRLFVSVTRASTLTNELISTFDSLDELIEVLIASCFIPYFLGVIPPKIKGVYYIDGGFTCNVPKLNDSTVTVSPFSDQPTIIKPRWEMLPDFTSTPYMEFRLCKSMFAPPPTTLIALCQQGYEDAVHFLHSRNRLRCQQCLTVTSGVHKRVRQQGRKKPKVPLSVTDCSACEDVVAVAESSKVSRTLLSPMIEAAAAEKRYRELHPVISTTAVCLLLVLFSILVFPITFAAVVTRKLYGVLFSKHSKFVGYARQVATQNELHPERQSYEENATASSTIRYGYSHC